MVMGTRRWGRECAVVAVIAGLVVLTACGGGSNGADAAVTVAPTVVDEPRCRRSGRQRVGSDRGGTRRGGEGMAGVRQR